VSRSTVSTSEDSSAVFTSNPMCCSHDFAACLRSRIVASLTEQGLSNGFAAVPVDSQTDKDALRRLHHVAVQHAIDRARPGLERHEVSLLKRIASGAEVRPEGIRPVLVEVAADTQDELLFLYPKLHWSIPISAGYGRRLRFLVIDESNSKLIGIIGLGDPIYRLQSRDNWIGWNSDGKRRRIGSVMDAFVLGAVPPYSMLLGSKLVALAACSLEVADAFWIKYGTSRSWIAKQQPAAGLAMITTTSALGRSSVYNRLKISDSQIFRSVGYTKGSGEFHFANELYAEILQFVREYAEPTAKHQAWGTGFRSKREVVLKALTLLDLPRSLIYHGVRREVFVAPLAANAGEFLRGEDQILEKNVLSLGEIASFFQDRWLLPRARWDGRYRNFSAHSFALWQAK
jgi:hypothetical protein